tara:strand:+ start:96 stop:422 length:327 start_codon:yes stop_codon:yes gene_type:complete
MAIGKDKKKIMFYDTDGRHAQLKVKLQYEGLTQTEFFRAMVTGFLEEDPNIVEYVEEYKDNQGVQSKHQRGVIAAERQASEEIKKNFGLDKDEISDIFDIIQKEHPDL